MIPQQPPIEAVFFDLDGTLLDTAPDLADACNRLLALHHRPPVTLAEFREWVHGGTAMMISKSFQIDTAHPDYGTLKSTFLQNYQQCLTGKTQLFPGIERVLQHLEKQPLPWGIVTNKHSHLAEPLLAHFGWTQRCRCLISGDTLATIKPHPAPLLHACRLTHVTPKHCIYIGDTLSDIQAAQAAGMRSIAVHYGYRPADSQIETWPADAWANTPDELISLLD